MDEIKFRNGALLSLAVLAACTMGPNRFQQFVGRSADSLIAYVGTPDDDRNIANHRVYIWKTDHIVPAFGGPILVQCKLVTNLNPDGMISKIEANSNVTGCLEFNNKLPKVDFQQYEKARLKVR